MVAGLCGGLTGKLNGKLSQLVGACVADLLVVLAGVVVHHLGSRFCGPQILAFYAVQLLHPLARLCVGGNVGEGGNLNGFCVLLHDNQPLFVIKKKPASEQSILRKQSGQILNTKAVKMQPSAAAKSEKIVRKFKKAFILFTFVFKF